MIPKQGCNMVEREIQSFCNFWNYWFCNKIQTLYFCIIYYTICLSQMVPNQRPWTLLLSWSSCNGSSIIMIMVVVMMVVIAVVLLYHDYGDGDLPDQDHNALAMWSWQHKKTILCRQLYWSIILGSIRVFLSPSGDLEVKVVRDIPTQPNPIPTFRFECSKLL